MVDRPLLRGGMMVLTSRGLAQLLRLGSILFLARLLGPDAFGLVGIAMIAMAALTTITDTGFDAALVQRRGDIQPYMNTVFCVKLVRAGLLAITLYILSPCIALFFNTPDAVAVLRGLTPVVLLEGLTNPAAVTIRRDLRFRRIAAWDLADAAAGMAGAILFGLWLGSVFAIVLAMVTAQLARTVSSYVLVPFRPRFEFNLGKAVELARFGVWVLVTNTAVFLLLYIDDVVVTRLLGAAALGLYQVAFRISNMPVTEMSHVVAQLSYPAYAQVQTDPAALRGLWLGVLGLTASIALPAAAIIALVARDVIPLALGPDWVGAVPVIQVLALFGALRALNAASGTLFNALGKPHLLARISAIQLLALSVIIVPAIRTAGLTGAAWAVTAANAFAFALVLIGAAKLTSISPRELVAAFRSALAIGAGVTVPLLLVHALFPSDWVVHRLAATLVVVAGIGVLIVGQTRVTAGHTVHVRP